MLCALGGVAREGVPLFPRSSHRGPVLCGFPLRAAWGAILLLSSPAPRRRSVRPRGVPPPLSLGVASREALRVLNASASTVFLMKLLSFSNWKMNQRRVYKVRALHAVDGPSDPLAISDF